MENSASTEKLNKLIMRKVSKDVDLNSMFPTNPFGPGNYGLLRQNK
jgi:hypothetical protein